MSAEQAGPWIRKAENDLLAADNNLASARIPYDVVCFHCQQAAEKLIKGVLVSLGAEPSRTHDLLALLETIRSLAAAEVPEPVTSSCVVLNPYAVEIRYPDDDWTAEPEDAREARQAAETVRNWALTIVSR